MAWKPGESGNPEGAKKHRLWISTLERAIKAEDGKRLREAAERLLTKAAEGEPWALKELGDRLDGKARQQIEAVDDQGRTLAIGLVAYANHPAPLSAETVPTPGTQGG
jgi:hypothetical protein